MSSESPEESILSWYFGVSSYASLNWRNIKFNPTWGIGQGGEWVCEQQGSEPLTQRMPCPQRWGHPPLPALCPASPIPPCGRAGTGRLVLLVFICLFPRCYDNPPESTSRAAASSNVTAPGTGGACLWPGVCAGVPLPPWRDKNSHHPAQSHPPSPWHTQRLAPCAPHCRQ